MCNERKDFHPIFENIKSCLIELGFSGVDEVIEEDSGKFFTGIQDQNFGMFIEITCQTDNVDIKVGPDLAFKVPEVVLLFQLINEINLRLMDIGHLSINEADEAVLLQTSVDFSDEYFDREQMLSTIKRIVGQGLEFFNLLKEIIGGDQCPFHLLHNYIEEKRKNQVMDQKTIH